MLSRFSKTSLLATSLLAGLAVVPSVQAQQNQDEGVQELIIVTGSRIARPDFNSESPVVSVTGEAIVQNADITLDTYLNTLPQVNPAGSTTSNNPGNNGQSNVNLRGFGANRNLVLIDGRRAMPSASNLTVDLNTIPQGLIDRLDVITGGAGAVYGADAVAGAVNLILKDDFEGAEFRATYQNSTEFWDAKEYRFAGTVGGNFAEGRGNAVLSLERSVREGMVKSQRKFAEQATSTTSFFPEGSMTFSSSNLPSEASIDAVFGAYGVDPAAVSVGNRFGFNLDGTLFSAGIFNNSVSNVENFRYDVDGSVNANIYPDAYSYNFDFVNLLTLPMERTSFMAKSEYAFDNGVEVWGLLGWTEYESASALAPTPIPTVTAKAPGEASSIQATSGLIEPGQSVSFQLIIPTTNPFIPDDLAAILASRTGDDARLVGSGATEPFLMRQRTLTAGLRQSTFQNTVTQFAFGLSGPIADSGWDWNFYMSEGRTEIDRIQTGNIDTNNLQTLLEASDGGESICEGGFNPFGRQPLSQECIDYLSVSSLARTEFTQRIGQGYVTGDVFEVPAGMVSLVLGAEYRGFEFNFDPGSGGGPISGFNAQTPNGGTNSFTDLFAESLVPLSDTVDLTLGYRLSDSKFEDGNSDASGGSKNSAYKAELSWQARDWARFRGSYQRSVRAPNFFELFGGGRSAPQYFDPCSVNGVSRQQNAAAGMEALCTARGLADPSTYTQTPGTQSGITTSGNTDLDPESANTYTLGVVWENPVEGNQWLDRLRGAIDWWQIDIKGPILNPGSNQIIADCYNYYGNNPNYDISVPSCQAIGTGGGDIGDLSLPPELGGDGTGRFLFQNGGKQSASGIDLQVNWGFDMEWFGLSPNAGTVQTSLLLTHVMKWEQQDSKTLPALDYAGTVSFFGSGLGTSFPEWKANWNTRYTVGKFDFDSRVRYISSMDNRASVIFPGEQFTGTDAAVYWDLSTSYQFTEGVAFKLGVNNVMDREPETYAPNVQSGTDPSLYDIVGRRVFGQLLVRY